MTSIFQKITNNKKDGSGSAKTSPTNDQSNSSFNNLINSNAAAELEALFLNDDAYISQPDLIEAQQQQQQQTTDIINDSTKTSTILNENGKHLLTTQQSIELKPDNDCFLFNNDNPKPQSQQNSNSSILVNHSSSLNSNSSTSGYGTSISGRSSPLTSANTTNNNLNNLTTTQSDQSEQTTSHHSNKQPKSPMNSLIDDLIILNNNKTNTPTQQIASQFDLINSYFNPAVAQNPPEQKQPQQVTFNLSINNEEHPQENVNTPSNQNNIINNNNNSNYSNLNYLLRRERSLDRCTATENFIENFGFTNNTSVSTANTPTRSRPYNLVNSQQAPTYSNSTLYLNNTSSRPHRQHHRSNSILNTNSITSNNPLTNLNPLNFTRDYGNTVVVGGGLRSSARALTTSNLIQRDASLNSVKSSNEQQSAQTNGGGQSSSQTNQSKLNFIKDLQIRLMDMQKECYYLRCELDSAQQKLTSSMQSIKQFWSPELKRERQQRKEETAKYNLLLEQYKLLQTQYQPMLESYEQQTVQMQQLQLQIQHMQQQQVQDDLMQTNSSQSTKHLLREKNLLKKTINELEMRINAQKQSLNTKDETIKKLFQIIKTLSNKNNSANGNDLYSMNNNSNDIVCICFIRY